MQEIIKLFAIMVMGFVIVKSGLMKSSDSKSLSVIMAYLINSCVIFDATPEVQKGLLLACIAATAVHILFLAVTVILKKLLNLDVVERATLVYPVLVLILMKIISNISSGSDTENILLTVYLASITPACDGTAI